MNTKIVSRAKVPVIIPTPKKVTMLDGDPVQLPYKVVYKKQNGQPEGYKIRITPRNGVEVWTTDAAGRRWADQTLAQLTGREGQKPCLEIEDWPTLSVRAVHLFHGQNALAFHTKLIERLFSPFKLNAIFLQCEQLKWDSDPKVAPSWGGTKADVRLEIAFAKKQGITVYPLVQSYGHMEWLFSKPQNREFAEDPATPYAVNITNPKAMPT